MSAESVGSCDGPPLKFAEPMRPFWEHKNSSPNTPDRPCYKKNVICYSCKQEGHYSPECPFKAKRPSPGSTPPTTLFPKCPQKYPDLPCKTCRRPCVVRTSSTSTNPGRDYYMCMNNACRMFQWCDEVGKIQSCGVNNPVKPVMQPGVDALQKCLCTAGPCRLETKQSGPHIGRKYFACHLKLGQGACDHFQWCDGLGDDVQMGNVVSYNVTTMEPNNTGMRGCGAVEARRKGAILLEDMDVSPVSPSLQPPTTPGSACKDKHRPSGSSPSRRPNSLEDSPTKRKRIEEEWVSGCPASPSLDCYLDKGSNNHVPHSAEPQPRWGHHSDDSRLVCSAVSWLRLSEDGATEPKKCAVCGDQAGHVTKECPALAWLQQLPV